MKENFNLIKYQLRKKSNILSIIIIGISLSIIVLLGTYLKSQDSYIKHERFDAIYFKTFTVYKEGSEKDIIKELKSIEHISNAVLEVDYQYDIEKKEFKTKKLNGNIWLLNSNNESIPKIVEGSNFPDDEGYYMVCPKNFYPTDSALIKNLNIYDKINIKKYLNKNINFEYFGNLYFYSEYDKSINPDNYIFNIDIKLVGLYKNDNYNFDENICYVNNKVIHDIVLNTYKDDVNPTTKESNYDLQKNGFVIEIDKASNKEKVIKNLESLGYTVEERAFLDTEGIAKTNSIITLICKLLIGIVAIFIFIMLEKEYEENKEYYQLLNVLGYNKKIIKRIYLSSYLLKILFWLIISLVVSSLVMVIFNIILYFFPFLLYKIRLIYDYKYVLIALIISLLVVFLNYAIHQIINFKINERS